MELSEVQKAFSAKVTEARIDAGYDSISKLSKATGISKSVLSAIERGTSNTCLDTIRRLAIACKVEPKFFFDWK